MSKEDADHITSRMKILDFMNSKAEEDNLSWISPVNIKHSRQILVELPQENIGFWSQNKKEFENISGRRLRIADIGCGRGHLTKELAEKYKEADVFGIDISAEAVKSAIIKLDSYSNGFAIGGDANKVLPELEEFDFIYAVNVIQDSKNPIQLLNKLEKNVRNGGYIAITVPGRAALEMFPNHRDFDDEKNLPFMIMEDINAEGEEVIWKQYAIPEEKIKQKIRNTNLEIVNEEMLPADASGLPKLMSLLEKEERIDQAKKIADKQSENPKKGPKVNFYLLKKEVS